MEFQKIILNTAVAAAVCVGMAGTAFAGKSTTIVGADASQWNDDTPAPPLFTVGGAGQLNGNFVIVEQDGIQMGLRATGRKDGPLPPVTGAKTGVYMACTGEDQGETDRAEWNYDWHLDLRGTDTTLADYKFTLTQTFTPSLFGSTGPLDLSFGGIVNSATLFQSSQNPNFGNDTFDQFAEGTYNLVLKLQPVGSGAPLIAHARVVVSDCP